jgi:hypothetical protein
MRASLTKKESGSDPLGQIEDWQADSVMPMRTLRRRVRTRDVIAIADDETTFAGLASQGAKHC